MESTQPIWSETHSQVWLLRGNWSQQPFPSLWRCARWRRGREHWRGLLQWYLFLLGRTVGFLDSWRSCLRTTQMFSVHSPWSPLSQPFLASFWQCGQSLYFKAEPPGLFAALICVRLAVTRGKAARMKLGMCSLAGFCFQTEFSDVMLPFSFLST